MRLATLVLLSWSTFVHAQHSEWQPIIDEFVSDERARIVMVGFYDDGETHTLVAGGPGDASSILEIGSITKVFTSLLVQVQVEAGNLDWDQSLADSLPDVAFANDDVAAITLRELSMHTSGLPRLPANMQFVDPNDPYAGYDRKLLLDFLEEFDPEALDPAYEYSNLGAGLLGEIAADASGARYAKAMQKDVLGPLALDSTTVGLRDEFDDRLVVGYSDGSDMANWSGFDALAGAGALTSSLSDMLSFIDSNLDDSKLSSALAAIRVEQGDGTTALGWHLRKVDGGTIHWHNGGTGGYASYLGIDVEKRKGVVVLTASTDYTGVTDLGFMLMSGNLPNSNTDDFATFEGVFELGQGFYLTIFEQGGRLNGQATGQGAFPLMRSGEKEFRFDAASIVIRYPERIDGQAASMLFSQAGNEIMAPRVDDALGPRPIEEIEIDPAVLNDYVGEYQLAPGAVITVEARDDQLFAQLTGQQSFPVFPFDEDKFFYKVVDAKLIFARDDDGRVIALTLDQGGLRLAPRIEE